MRRLCGPGMHGIGGIPLVLTGVGTSPEKFDIYTRFATGDDVTGEGSLSNPYKTFGKALSMASNGSRIGLIGDSATPWREWVMTTALNNLLIKGVSGYDTPTFYNTTNYASWSKTGGQTNVYQAAYTPAACYGVVNGSTWLTSVANVATCDSTANSFYADVAGDLLYVNIGGGAPTSLEVSEDWQYWLTLSGTGNTVQDIALSHSAAHGLRLTGASNTVTELSGTVWGDRRAINVEAASCVINSCTITTVDECVWVGNSAASTTVSYCTLVSSGVLPAIRLLAGNSHIVNNNTVSGSYDSIAVYAGTGTVVRYNTIYNPKHAGIMVVGSGVTADVHHNVIYDTADIGVQNNYGFVIENGAAVNLYHNTVANLLNCPSCNRGYGVYILSGGGAGASVVARNNLMYKCQVGFQAAAGQTIDSDYNCVNGNGADYVTWPSDTHKITTDPLFVNEGAFDYELQALSPCRGAGEFVAGISEQNPPTIGRYEYAT